MKKNKLTQSLLKKLLNYDPDTGIWTWNVSRGKNNCEGMRAGCVDTYHGYRRISINDISYRSARLAWFYSFGRWPKGHIDHINHNKLDDRVANLRDVKPIINQRNRPLHSNNTSGICGIRFHDGKYEACIIINQKYIYLGRFTNKCDAIAARKAAECGSGFHTNHGKRR